MLIISQIVSYDNKRPEKYKLNSLIWNASRKASKTMYIIDNYSYPSAYNSTGTKQTQILGLISSPQNYVL